MKDLKQAPVNHIIILVNIVIFLMVEITGSWENADHMLRWGATGTLDIWENHEYYRLFTAMFLHFGLGSNSVDRHEEQLSRIHSRYESIQITTGNTKLATLTFASSPIHRPCSLELTREFVHEHSHE